MDSEFWHERWELDQIGFHRAQVNPYLRRHAQLLGPGEGQHVLVPLCGKSQDMLWLAGNGCRVLGIELSPIAARIFFVDNDLPYVTEDCDGFAVYSSRNISIWCGDFFNMKKTRCADITGVFDRAALIALPPDQRRDYAKKLLELAPVDASILLVCMDYDQQQMKGPPFSVPSTEVKALFGGHREIETLQCEEILQAEPRFKAKGLTRLREQVYLLT